MSGLDEMWAGPGGRRFTDEHRPGCPYEDGIGDYEAERRAIESGYTTAELDQLHTYRANRDPKW